MESILNEYCNMNLMLGACVNRANGVAREYEERYAACCLPNANVFHYNEEELKCPTKHHKWIEVGHTLSKHQHSKRLFCIW
jgi:hypothetical protein